MRLRREQRQAAVDPEQPALFELREDCRPAADFIAVGALPGAVPVHADGAERYAALLAERNFRRIRQIKS